MDIALAQPQQQRAINEATASFQVPEALIRRFNSSGPRYTSYPTADRFLEEFAQQDYLDALAARANSKQQMPLSLYFHLPFCTSLCYFCACNKIITQDKSRSAEYLQYLFKEMAMVVPHLGDDRKTGQLHLGGGSPTFLSNDQMSLLMQEVRKHFDFTDDAEISVEIDPRTIDDQMLAHLASLGFNRTSFGVQDFDVAVQEAIHRIQPYDMVAKAIETSRAVGFQSINTDLIYGLPKQSVQSFSATLDQLIALRPDRIALYNYAHLPQRFKAQRLINEQDLPDAETRLQIFLMATQRLLDAGYDYIGLDHFALPDDELSRARVDQSLHRNFQGYTTRADSDLVAFGVSAIGKVQGTHVQNDRSLKAYYACLDENRLPVSRGIQMTADDELRAEVIMQLMCSMPVDKALVSQRHGIDFDVYFGDELQRLSQFEEAGLITVDERMLRVTDTGRLFVRGISMVFDAHLHKRTTATYSRLI
ncbi:oxygen-independent coproporphyrinogen III oxidase [Paenalcaligenes sp. Me131]|uniref:oxygen-independent coproporphyrinogen III oxidase n=1 Tax=Paenalcaligenes sp. Me131 TaxID=3392636 RepID=UPI003D27EC1F